MGVLARNRLPGLQLSPLRLRHYSSLPRVTSRQPAPTLSGSGITRFLQSTMPSSFKSLAVIFIAAAAVSAFVGSRQMIEAHPSGEITE